MALLSQRKATAKAAADAEGTKPKWAAQNRWNNANRLKLRAHSIVRVALRRGTLKRGRCEVCGSFLVEGHHDDYSLPLVVRWLCRKDHQQHHAQQRRAAA